MKLSASQVSKYRRCKRIIGFSYNEKIKEPSSIKQQFGTDVHKEQEGWLSKARMHSDTPAGRVAKQGVRFLPTPGEHLLVEKYFQIDWQPGVTMIGYIDCVSPSERLVIDHKTTSNLRWMKTVAQLKGDEQAIIYAIWMMLAYNVSSTRARWVYYSAMNPKRGARKPNGSQFVEIEFRAKDPEFQRHVRQLLADTRDIANIREGGKKGIDLPASPESCGAFGGCFYKQFCDMEAVDVLAAHIEQDCLLNR